MKPLHFLGSGVYEIRIHEDGEFRVFYLAQRADATYVLHAFRKESRQTRSSGLGARTRRSGQARAGNMS